MRRQWTGVLIVVAAVVTAGAALVRFAGPRDQVGVGSAAPEFRAVDVRTDDSVSLGAGYAGAVTLINIWATDCPPCREEMPAIERLYQALRPEGLRVAAISTDRADRSVVRAFADEFRLSFDILHDRSGGIERSYQTTGVPESFLLDRRGRIVRKAIGPVAWDSPSNQRVIRELLAAR